MTKRLGTRNKFGKALKTCCKADVERFCPTVEPGGGHIKNCPMQRHKEEMSEGGAQALPTLQKAKQKSQ